MGGEAEEGGAAQAVRALGARLGLPKGLGAEGVKADVLERLADKAFEDACHRSSPRPCSRADSPGALPRVPLIARGLRQRDRHAA